MSKCIDLTGARFGRWVVINKAIRPPMSNRQGAYWLCQCDCGNKKVVHGKPLRENESTSCGCFQKEQTINYIKKKSRKSKVQKVSRVEILKSKLINVKFSRLVVLEYAGRNKSNIHTFKCLCDCGNITFADYISLKGRSKRSCGCLALEIIKARCGINHPSWNSSISDEERQSRLIDKRSSVEYKNWRLSIFKRDNFTCLKCNNRSNIINAHHILGYAKFPEHRYDINNGITLCYSCHKKFHSLYGKDGNLKDELHEYLRDIKCLNKVI